MESIETTGPRRPSTRIRKLALGALSAAALAIPAVSAFSVTGHDAWGRSHARPDSHRLAGETLRPLSLRLT